MKHPNIIEETAASTNYGASFITVVAGLTINEWVAIGGFFMGLLMYGTYFWFKAQKLKLLKKSLELDELSRGSNRR